MKFHTAETRLWLNTQTGYYNVQYKDDRGKWQRKSLRTKDRRTATRLYNTWRREYLKGHIQENDPFDSMTIGMFIEEWIPFIETKHGRSTFVQYRATATKFSQALGKLPIRELSQKAIDFFLNDLICDGLSKTTVNKHSRHLKVLLNTAKDWKYIEDRPKMSSPLAVEKKIKYMTDPEWDALLSAIESRGDHEFKDLCILAMATGMRSGELISLVETDVDNPEGYLRVSEKQKNKTESRIPINKLARPVLDKRILLAEGPRLFRYKTADIVSRWFGKYRDLAGLNKGLTFHSIRHTFGTKMVSKKADLRTIQGLLRHVSFKSTEVYANVIPDHLRETSELMDFKTGSEK